MTTAIILSKAVRKPLLWNLLINFKFEWLWQEGAPVDEEEDDEEEEEEKGKKGVSCWSISYWFLIDSARSFDEAIT